MKLKICILIESLNSGGAERSAGILSNILSNLGHQVYLITIFNDVIYPYSGKHIYLDNTIDGSVSFFKKLNRYFHLFKIVKQQKFNLILDFRLKYAPLRELVLNRLIFKKITINMVRSSNLKWYFPDPKFVSNLLYRNYLGINVVSLKLKEKIEENFKFTNVTCVYNPVDIKGLQKKSREYSVNHGKFILAVGRLEPVKQFDKLINSYKDSDLPSQDIKLYILGNGTQYDKIIQHINALNLQEYVKVLPFKANPFGYMRQSEFLVMSSKFEGFPRVLLESLAIGTPVVSFDCETGPDEIIKHKVNGLLVENQNFSELTYAMNEMIINHNLYNICKNNCEKSIEKFSIDKIEKKWQIYFLKIFGIARDSKI